MKDPAGKMHTSRDIYESGTKQVEYSVYLKILRLYFTGFVTLLLKGYHWNVGHHLSTIYIQKIKRKYTKPRVDWGETRKLRALGKLDANEVYYYTDQPYWYRFYWNKHNCKVPNMTRYKFTITIGPLGNSRKLSTLLQTDPFAHLNFTPSSYDLQDRKQL